MWLWIGLGVVIVIIVLAIILMYNSLIVSRNRVDNSMAQVDVQLKKRNDLVPNLVQTVKGYAKHERKVFTDVTKARAAVMKSKGLQQKAKASNMLTDALKSLFAVAENYPKLQASQNFIKLQEELSDIEDKIAYARQFYNDSVLIFNNKIQVFPTNIFARRLGFKQKVYFEAEAPARKTPKVRF